MKEGARFQGGLRLTVSDPVRSRKELRESSTDEPYCVLILIQTLVHLTLTLVPTLMMKKLRQRDEGPGPVGYGVGLEAAGPKQAYDEDFQSGEQDAIIENIKGVLHQTEQGGASPSEGVMLGPEETRQVKSRENHCREKVQHTQRP